MSKVINKSDIKMMSQKLNVNMKYIISDKNIDKLKTENKIEIKKAVEDIYKVSVDNVRVMTVRGKKKRVRFREGMTSSWKKAIVTLKPDNRIEVT